MKIDFEDALFYAIIIGFLAMFLYKQYIEIKAKKNGAEPKKEVLNDKPF